MGPRDPRLHVWNCGLFAFALLAGCAEGAPPFGAAGYGSAPVFGDDAAVDGAADPDAGAPLPSTFAPADAGAVMADTGTAPTTAADAAAEAAPPAINPPTGGGNTCGPSAAALSACDGACGKATECSARLPLLFSCSAGCASAYGSYVHWPGCIDALQAFFTCVAALDCAGMGNAAVSCADTFAPVQDACSGSYSGTPPACM